jgi:hypothetical protein
MPMLCSSFATAKPGLSASTRDAVIPREGCASGSVTAKTTLAAATPALLIQLLLPLNTQPHRCLSLTLDLTRAFAVSAIATTVINVPVPVPPYCSSNGNANRS